jgi:hypothetical protein
MRGVDPLSEWLYYTQAPSKASERTARAGKELSEALHGFEAELAAAPPGKVDFYRLDIRTPYGEAALRLAPADRELAERLYLAVWNRSGPGATYVLHKLSHMVALARDPQSIPFWQQVLELSRPREQKSAERVTTALAALALLVARKQDAAAETALAAALRHRNEKARAYAAYALGLVYHVLETPPPPAVQNELAECAAEDSALLTRYKARVSLRALNLPVPHDPPDTVYHFNVNHRYAPKVTRTVALQAKQTLRQLHSATQRAFAWDADHLYAFYISGEKYDQGSEIRCPQMSDNAPLFDFSFDLSPKSRSYHAGEVELGFLGLLPKHSFLYYFDFGDSHEFNVKVVAVHSEPGPGEYPQLIAATGGDLIQYPDYDEEEGWGDEETQDSTE